MQVSQREALDDPRPVVAIMAHAYPGPGGGDGTRPSPPSSDVVISALLAADNTDSTGPESRYISLPANAEFRPKKPGGGAWRGSDGVRVVEGALPEGLVKRGWLRKYTLELPGVLVYFSGLDLAASPEAWAVSEARIVQDIRRVTAALAPRDTKILLVLVRGGSATGPGGGREDRDLVDDRVFSLRRAAEVDARQVVVMAETDIGPLNSPAMRQVAKQARDLALNHYAKLVARLRRWEKVLVPVRRLYRPLLTRLYFKLGVLLEMQGQIDRTVACYQEVSALLSEIVHSGHNGSQPLGSLEGGALAKAPAGGGALLLGADSMEQIRGVGEVVHLRLVSNHLRRNMSVEGAVRQMRRHVSAFSGQRQGQGQGFTEGVPGAGVGAVVEGRGEQFCSVVPYRHHDWLSRQYLSFGEMLGEHLNQFPMRGNGAPGMGYSSPGYYYLSAALHAVRRRKVSDRVLAHVSVAELESKLEGLEAQPLLYLGESVCLADPSVGRRDLRSACRASLDLEELAFDRSGLACSLLAKALEHCPDNDQRTFLRRRALILRHLGEEHYHAGRFAEAWERFSSVWAVYRRDGWMELAASTLAKMHRCAWELGKANNAVTTALTMASWDIWPSVPAEARMGLVSMAMAIVGAGGSVYDDDEEGRGEGQVFLKEAFVPAKDQGVEFGGEQEGKPLLVEVNDKMPLLRIAGRFSPPSTSPGETVTLRLALLSLLPVGLRLRSLELEFNYPLMNHIVFDEECGLECVEGGDRVAVGEAGRGLSVSTSNLNLARGGLVEVEVALKVPDRGGGKETSTGLMAPLRLRVGKALVCDNNKAPVEAGVAGCKGGVIFSVQAGPAALVVAEKGGMSWARVRGAEQVDLVTRRALATVRIEPPRALLVGAVNRLDVTVALPAGDAPPKDQSDGTGDSSGTSGGDGRGGALQLRVECDPPVPRGLGQTPGPKVPGTTTPSTVSGAGVVPEVSQSATGQKLGPEQESVATLPPSAVAFFWGPSSSIVEAGAGTGEVMGVGGGSGGVGGRGFVPVMVGSDGQPVRALAVPPCDVGAGEVTVPLWVRSEVPGRKVVRATVDNAPKTSGGKEQLELQQGKAEWDGLGQERATWASAEVVFVRPLVASVDIVPLQDHSFPPLQPEDAPVRAHLGQAVAVKVVVTNPQERQLSILRMEIAPPSDPNTRASDSGGGNVGYGGGQSLPARLLEGPILYNSGKAPSRLLGGEEGGTGAGGGILLAKGDAHACCTLAVGEMEGAVPLGVLVVHWRAWRGGKREGEGKGEWEEGVTELRMPDLSVVSPPLSARIWVPAHARVGEAFTMRWEVSNPNNTYSNLRLSAEGGGEFVWSGSRQFTLQVAPRESASVSYCLVPMVPGHVVLPRVTIVHDKQQVNIVPDAAEGRLHIFVHP